MKKEINALPIIPVRVFVACTPSEWLPMRVLEFSIKETTSLPVELSAIYSFNRPIPIPQALTNRARTPFSFQRFLIPELCNHAGKAIYLDADMQVFRDISELWNHDFTGCDLQTVEDAQKGRRGQFSVMLLDCEALAWDVEQIIADLDAGKLTYAALMYEMKVAKKIGRDISHYWNALERYEKDKTRLLHYTDMNTQPWVSTSNPLGYLWVACLRRAIATSFISLEEIEREINLGHVRPSLLAQINEKIDDCVVLPSWIRKLDRHYSPPYKKLKSGKNWQCRSLGSALLAFLRHCYYKSFLARLF